MFSPVFFFQAEDGIRDIGVTGVQTCALPISTSSHHPQLSPPRGSLTILARTPADGREPPGETNVYSRARRVRKKTLAQPFGEERAVASDERLRELEEKYEGYKVYDNRGDRIGKVDDLFVDESDNEEYIGVKLGLFGMKSTLIPMEIARVNEAERAIEVSDSKDHVQDAPTFGDDDEVTAGYEDRIRSHFGLESLATSSSRGSYGAYSGTSSGTDYDSEESKARSSGTPTQYRD